MPKPRKTKVIKGDHPVSDDMQYKVVYHPAEVFITYYDDFRHINMKVRQKGGWKHEALIRLTPDACKELADVLTNAFESAASSV